MDFAKAILVEAWRIYLRSASAPSMEDFTLWAKENQPDVYRVMSDRAFASIAEDVAKGRLSAPKGV